MLKAIVYWFVVGLIIGLIYIYFAGPIWRDAYSVASFSVQGSYQLDISAAIRIIIPFAILTAIFGIVYQLIFRKK